MAERPRLLVSACLAGLSCRYDGGANRLDGLDRLAERYILVPVCPEQLGGLPTPRAPAERVGGRVVNREGADVTHAFALGAAQAAHIGKLAGARLALLKSRSPSCGSGAIYDGSFSGRLVPGDGMAAGLLKAQGVRVYTEEEVDELLHSTEEDKP